MGRKRHVRGIRLFNKKVGRIFAATGNRCFSLEDVRKSVKV